MSLGGVGEDRRPWLLDLSLWLNPPCLLDRSIREGKWRSETDRPSNMNDRACENTHPSRAANMAIHGLNSKAASDFLDNEDSQSPLKASVVSGYHVIHGKQGHGGGGREGGRLCLLLSD